MVGRAFREFLKPKAWLFVVAPFALINAHGLVWIFGKQVVYKDSFPMFEFCSEFLSLSNLQHLSKVKAFFILLDKDVFLELIAHFLNFDLTKINRLIFLKEFEDLLQLLLTDWSKNLLGIVLPLLLMLFLPRLHLLLEWAYLEQSCLLWMGFVVANDHWLLFLGWRPSRVKGKVWILPAMLFF